MASSSSDYSLFALDRAIDTLYADLPWPEELKRIGCATIVKCGYGDLSAVAKVIRILKRLSPELNFTWIVSGSTGVGRDTALVDKARRFFPDEKEILIGQYQYGNPAHEVDFAIAGPSKEPLHCVFGKFKSKDLSKSTFGFVENGFKDCPEPLSIAKKTSVDQLEITDLYPLFFDHYFHLQGTPLCIHEEKRDRSFFSMGLKEGTGILLEPDLCKAELPLGGYADPFQLTLIEDEVLKQNILSAMEGDLEYRTHSFNSGYAWYMNTKLYFIDVVARQLALHEPGKNAVFVFNQTNHGVMYMVDTYVSYFEHRDQYLKEQGFGTIEIIGSENRMFVTEGPGLKITIILSPFIQPVDMKRVQLASERLLTTGDNTAAEGLAARCKLFLYEKMDHKGAFFRQQIQCAQAISPDLAQLIQIFGDNVNCTWGMSSPLDGSDPKEAEDRVKMDALLQKSSHYAETIAFCNEIIERHSFEPFLKNALLRTAYRSLYPELAAIERDCLEERVKEAFVRAIVTGKFDARFSVDNLPLMRERIINHINGELHGKQ